MKNHFYGWYFRCFGGGGSVAVIPSVHSFGEERIGSVQIITDTFSASAEFPGSAIGSSGIMEIGKNRFFHSGMEIDITTPSLTANGNISFGPLMPIKYDIMGPFKYVPYMQCRHSVMSMRHSVDGNMHINGRHYSFSGGIGYIEGDRGCSFPERYLWTQCFFDCGSLMLSAADIPYMGARFTGIISVVMIGGKEYRIATYLGARPEKIKDGEAVIKQGPFRLTAKLISANAQPLSAPVFGKMARTIHENLSCRAYYRLEKGGQTLLEFESDNAAFEYEYPF